MAIVLSPFHEQACSSETSGRVGGGRLPSLEGRGIEPTETNQGPAHQYQQVT